MTDQVDQVAAAIVARLQASAEPVKPLELRQAIGCTPSQWAKAVQRLRWQGKLEFDSLTLAASLRPKSPDASLDHNRQEERPAPSQGAATEGAALANKAPAAGGAPAREIGAPPADDDPMGLAVAAELLDECEAFIAEHGLAPSTFGKLAAGATMLLEGLRNAKRGPQRRTVRRVRRFMAEWRERAADAQPPRGEPGSRNAKMRSAALIGTAEQRAEEAKRLAQVDAARNRRRPGETLADAVRREALEDGERRACARASGGGVQPIDLKRVPHHPKARKFEPLPAEIWAELRRLADELGEPAAELLPRAVEQGIAAIRRAA